MSAEWLCVDCKYKQGNNCEKGFVMQSIADFYGVCWLKEKKENHSK